MQNKLLPDRTRTAIPSRSSLVKAEFEFGYRDNRKRSINAPPQSLHLAGSRNSDDITPPLKLDLIHDQKHALILEFLTRIRTCKATLARPATIRGRLASGDSFKRNSQSLARPKLGLQVGGVAGQQIQSGPLASILHVRSTPVQGYAVQSRLPQPHPPLQL